MNIQIVNASSKTYSNIGRYFFAEMIAGKHHASFAFGPLGVQVCVHNAANRAWKGLGKQFSSTEAALANYKTAEIRSMIQEAARMSQEAD
jgi:hypothetical protein